MLLVWFRGVDKYIHVIILTCRDIALLFSSYLVEQWQVLQFLGAFSLTSVIVLIRIVCHDNIIFGIKFDSIVLCIIILIRKVPNPMIKLPTSNMWQPSVTTSLKTWSQVACVHIYSRPLLCRLVCEKKPNVNNGIRRDSSITVTFSKCSFDYSD